MGVRLSLCAAYSFSQSKDITHQVSLLLLKAKTLHTKIEYSLLKQRHYIPR